MNIKEIDYNTWHKFPPMKKEDYARMAFEYIKDLKADLLTASTRDTAQLELIGKLEAENKRLREAVRKAVYHWMYRIDYHHVDSHKTRKLIDDALLKDS